MSRLLGARPLLLLTSPGTQVQQLASSTRRLVSGPSSNNNHQISDQVKYFIQSIIITTEQLLPTVISVS